MAFTLFFILLCTLSIAFSALPEASISFVTNAPLYVLDPYFVSINIDTASLDARMDLTDPSLINIIKQLGPVWIRIGGTSSNNMIYSPNGIAGDSGGRCHINDAYWKDVGYLQQQTGANILMALPVTNGANGVYDPTINATELWASTAKNNIKIGGWSLGNELIGGNFNVEQYVSDYKIFATALKQYPTIGQRIAGPSALGWLPTSLPVFFNGTESFISEFTFHLYPFGNCNLDYYAQKSNTDHMAGDFANFNKLRNSIAPKIPLVLEETATQAGGGCEGLSDRFVSGFWWVHALGLAAEGGTARVHRQDIAGFSFNKFPSHYMLAGIAGWVNTSASGPLSPHPDWFTSVLHKQLAGSILNSTLTSKTSGVLQNVAVHVWCSAAGAKVPAGSVTLSYINTGTTANDTLLVLPSPFSSLPLILYILTPGTASSSSQNEQGPKEEGVSAVPNSLTSDTILLNGEVLSVSKEGVLPVYPIPGKTVNNSDNLVLPAWSYGFIVISGANVEACK